MQNLWSSDQYDPVKYALAVGFIFVALWEPHDSCWRSKEEKASLACPGHHRTGPRQDDCNTALSAHLILDQTGLAMPPRHCEPLALKMSALSAVQYYGHNTAKR